LADAYLLLSHGSRDPRPQIAIDQLAQQLSLWLQQSAAVGVGVSLPLGTASPLENHPPILVGTAQLELAAQPLSIQIRDFANRSQTIGLTRVVILPLFLIPGVHVMEDIPAEVTIAEREIGGGVKLVVTPWLGSHPDLGTLFAQHSFDLPRQTIILAHGSRRAGGNAIVEQLANRLDLTAAYWSVAPSLGDTVATLIATGTTEIGILPYFLFAGGITDAIAELVAQLRQQYPQLNLTLGEPIGNHPELVEMVGKILKSLDS
jgi:sirohydrochlorin cobaltochelatase